jgi:hypothetical protein
MMTRSKTIANATAVNANATAVNANATAVNAVSNDTTPIVYPSMFDRWRLPL